jgi:hypothetical protein
MSGETGFFRGTTSGKTSGLEPWGAALFNPVFRFGPHIRIWIRIKLGDYNL